MPASTNSPSVRTGDQPARLHLTSGGRDLEAQPPAPRRRGRSRPAQRLEAIELALHRWLVAHSLTILRVSLGAVFLGFGFLKFFPGVSPAEDLAVTTTSILTFNLVPGSIAILAIAVLECVIGLWLLSGRALRGAIYVLAVELIGILAPVVLLGSRLFSGPHHAPTLEGQYVLKDVIIVGAVLIIATTVRGGRLTSAGEKNSECKHCGYAPEQVIRELREADRMPGEDRTTPEIANRLRISENTHHGRRDEYGGMKADAVDSPEGVRAREWAAHADRCPPGIAHRGLRGSSRETGEPGPQAQGDRDAA